MNTKSFASVISAAALVGVTALFAGNASAQTAQQAPITRAQVKAQLAELEAAGYRPGGDDVYYPDDIQAAEQRVQAAHAARQTASASVNDPEGAQTSEQ
jgi:hypothetical protein